MKFEQSNKKFYPKISCLTVTGWNLILLKQAINCFCDQSYSNKELVIVTDGKPAYKEAISAYLRYLGRTDIMFIQLEDTYKLGALRNIAIASANGELIAQWDDDDLYHPDRLSLQYEQLQKEKADACLLSDQLSYFQSSKEMFWVDWIPYFHSSPIQQVFPGSILAFKDKRYKYPESGQYASKGEDSIFLSQYFENGKIARLSGKGYIYVYRYHGTNTFPEAHHQAIADIHARDTDFIQANLNVLHQALGYYCLPQPFVFLARKKQRLFVYKN